MSQEKVNKYKQLKINRKNKKKRVNIKDNLWKVGLTVVAVVFVGWILYSGVVKYYEVRPQRTATIDWAAIQSYTGSIKTVETEAEEKKKKEEEEAKEKEENKEENAESSDSTSTEDSSNTEEKASE